MPAWSHCRFDSGQSHRLVPWGLSFLHGTSPLLCRPRGNGFLSYEDHEPAVAHRYYDGMTVLVLRDRLMADALDLAPVWPLDHEP